MTIAKNERCGLIGLSFIQLLRTLLLIDHAYIWKLNQLQDYNQPWNKTESIIHVLIRWHISIATS